MAEHKETDASGMAGEFFVMQALYRLGYQPALTMGNAKKIDILLAGSDEKTIRISVKSVRGGGKWPVGPRKWKAKKETFFVFLHYANFEDVKECPKVFVVPVPKVDELKKKWLDSSYAVYFSADLEPYKDAWDLLDKKLKKS